MYQEFPICTSYGEGIHIWPEPFLTKDKDGREMAVILLAGRIVDHDGQYKIRTKFTIRFALAFSSVTIYETDHGITNRDMENVSESLIPSDESVPQYNQFKFVIHEWLYDNITASGSVGGSETGLDTVFETATELVIRLVEVTKQSFKSVTGCILPCNLRPYPWHCDRFNDDTLASLDRQFKQSIDQLCKDVLVNQLTTRRKWNAPEFCRNYSTIRKQNKNVENGQFIVPNQERPFIVCPSEMNPEQRKKYRKELNDNINRLMLEIELELEMFDIRSTAAINTA